MGATPQCFWEFLGLEGVVNRSLEWLDLPEFDRRHLNFIIVGLQSNCRELAHHEVIAPALCVLLQLLCRCRKLESVTDETREVLRVATEKFNQELEDLAYLKERWVPQLADTAPISF